jgi:hypothetical protein
VQSGSPAGPRVSQAELLGRSQTGQAASCNCGETSDKKEFLQRGRHSYDRVATECIGGWPTQVSREMAVCGGIVNVFGNQLM